MWSRPTTTIVSTTQASSCLSFSKAFSSEARRRDARSSPCWSASPRLDSMNQVVAHDEEGDSDAGEKEQGRSGDQERHAQEDRRPEEDGGPQEAGGQDA